MNIAAARPHRSSRRNTHFAVGVVLPPLGQLDFNMMVNE
jgi:hypothetical protein